MPNKNNNKYNLTNNNNITNTNNTQCYCSDEEAEEIVPKTEGSNNILPSSGFSDRDVLIFYDFLKKLEKRGGGIDELNCQKTDNIGDILEKLNKRIIKCKKYEKDGIELSKKLVNNYVIINEKNCLDYDDDLCEQHCLDTEVRKFKGLAKIISIGYIYRILLDINSKSFFHVYLRPLIRTDTLGTYAQLSEEIIINATFEELSTLYQIITKEEYERRIRKLFIERD